MLVPRSPNSHLSVSGEHRPAMAFYRESRKLLLLVYSYDKHRRIWRSFFKKWISLAPWPPGAKPNRFLLHLNILANSFYPPKYSSSKNTQISISGQLTSACWDRGRVFSILKRASWLSFSQARKKKTNIGVCFLSPTNNYLELVLCVSFSNCYGAWTALENY